MNYTERLSIELCTTLGIAWTGWFCAWMCKWHSSITTVAPWQVNDVMCCLHTLCVGCGGGDESFGSSKIGTGVFQFITFHNLQSDTTFIMRDWALIHGHKVGLSLPACVRSHPHMLEYVPWYALFLLFQVNSTWRSYKIKFQVNAFQDEF